MNRVDGRDLRDDGRAIVAINLHWHGQRTPTKGLKFPFAMARRIRVVLPETRITVKRSRGENDIFIGPPTTYHDGRPRQTDGRTIPV